MLTPLAKTYGENLKRARGKRPQETIAAAMGLQRQGNLSQYETGKKFPTPELVVQHARGVGWPTWRLLEYVEMPYDEQRRGDEAFDLMGRFRLLNAEGKKIVRAAFRTAELATAAARQAQLHSELPKKVPNERSIRQRQV